MRALLLLAALLCLPAVAEAQTVEPPPPGDVDVPPGEDVIVIATRGVAAPISGQLLDPATALRWGNRTVRYRMMIRFLTDEVQTCREETSASTAIQLRIVEDSLVRENDGLRTDIREQATRYEGELADFRNPPLYETWGFAFASGGVVVAVVVGVIGGVLLSR